MKDSPETSVKDVPDGATVYTHRSLRVYDFLVHVVSNRLAWRCPTRNLHEFGRKSLSPNHLEVGIGSGKLFKKTSSGQTFQRLVIADVNENCLDFAKTVLSAKNPSVLILDLLDPRFFEREDFVFESIGLNYVLHCLPITLHEKVKLCSQFVNKCLTDKGELFGSTIFPNLNDNWISRRLIRFYNRKKIFHNDDDRVELFEQLMGEQGFAFELSVKGCVGMFRIRKD